MKSAIIQGKQKTYRTVHLAHRILSHSISKGLPGEETSAKARANMYSQLYIAGDKYDVPRMRELATGEFMATVENDWDEATFIPLIRSVFEGTASESNGLREGIIKATLRHIDVLEERQDFNHLLEDLPSFSHQLLQCVIMNAAKQKRYHCHELILKIL